MSNPFDTLRGVFEDLTEDEPERRLSPEEREAIKARIHKEEVEERMKEMEDVANTMPMMMDSFRKAGVHKELAKFMFEFYSELKAAGFTDAQAIQIASTNFNIQAD